MPELLTLRAVCAARCAEPGGADWTKGCEAEGAAARVAQTAGLDMRAWCQ